MLRDAATVQQIVRAVVAYGWISREVCTTRCRRVVCTAGFSKVCTTRLSFFRVFSQSSSCNPYDKLTAVGAYQHAAKDAAARAKNLKNGRTRQFLAALLIKPC